MSSALPARALALALIFGIGGAPGCGVAENVIRVVDGDVMVTRYVPAEAYSAFLAGALAEADGRLDYAYSRYKDALSVDDTDPLVWARLARVACRIHGHRADAESALSRALTLDPSLSAALAADGECADLRKDTAHATQALLLAAANEPRNAELDGRANRELSTAAPDAARSPHARQTPAAWGESESPRLAAPAPPS